MTQAPALDSSGVSSATDPDVSPAAAEETATERRLVELLQRASRTIKSERARAAELRGALSRSRAENEALRAELGALRVQCSPQAKRSGSAQPARGQSAPMPRQKKTNAKEERNERLGGVSGNRMRCPSPSVPRATGSPPNTEFSVKAADRANACGDSNTNTQCDANGNEIGEAEGVTRAAEAELWCAPQPDTSPYCAGMISRLRRAMAPLPTREQLGEVIHAMVKEIVRDARRRGVDLRMSREAPCVYRCVRQSFGPARKNASRLSRVLHLSIDSGRLTVKVGGGHENLLEYLERHRYFAVG